RTLARNAFESIGLGHPVIVTGRLRTHEWTDESGEQRSRVILEAFSLGHDLNRGTARFTKNAPRSESFGPTGQTPEVTAAPYPPDEFTTTSLPLSTERPAAA